MNLTRSERERRTRSLRAARWCWPQAGTHEFREALSLVSEGPPALSPGEVPLVTVDARGFAGSLWCLRMGAADHEPGLASFEGSARRAWQNAALAVPRSLPLLWSDVRRVAQRDLHAEHLAQHLLRDGAAPPAQELTGTSFGLSFVLALTSLVIDRPLPDTWVATAEVSADGAIGPVEGLEAKIAVIERHAPHLSQLLVAAAQEEAAHSLAGRLEIVPVRSAAQAIRRVFGDDAFAACLGAYAADATQRSEVVDFFFRQALVGSRRVYVDWGPIARAATTALETWTGLDANDRWRLELARGIADRHAGGRTAISAPSDSQLRRFPRSLRVSLVAQLVQHCHDVGTPSPKEMEPYLADTSIFVPLEDAFAQHLAAWGTRARLLASTGKPAEALRLQENLAMAWVERLEYAQTTFPLSEWFRLGGALATLPHGCTRAEATAAVDRAERLYGELAARVGFDPQSAGYVDLARTRARLVRLGDSSGRAAPADDAVAAADTVLARLADDEVYVPWHVRFAALRLRIALCESSGDSRTAAILGRMLADADSGENSERTRAAHRAAILVRLDRALRHNDDEEAAIAVDLLTADDPGPMGHLRAVADPPRGRAAYVAAYYPY